MMDKVKEFVYFYTYAEVPTDMAFEQHPNSIADGITEAVHLYLDLGGCRDADIEEVM
jgi:hypothetical protein